MVFSPPCTGQTGEFSFGNDVTNVYSEISYDRPNKNAKILSRIPQSNDGLTFDHEKAITKNYDVLCAVDTNTISILDQKFSAIGAVIAIEAMIPAPTGLRKVWKFHVLFGAVILNPKSDKIENMGWLIAHQQLSQSGVIKDGDRLGMIVDSDLGNINDYNHRRKPAYQDMMLPSGMSLIYASGDVGKDILLNKTLSIADSIASQSLAAVSQGRIPIIEVDDKRFYDGIRFFEPIVEHT